MTNWDNEIERVKNDNSYNEQEKKNIIAYYEIQKHLEQYARERKEKAKRKARARILSRRLKILSKKLKETEKELYDILNDGKTFYYFETIRFREKYLSDKETD